ncbi:MULTISPECIES: hypothetical protein [unclassified Chryseobacterium]|uniref:hypothetical protein n=1 Tax=unclassified Chryseobacterium TaxID=2593645 RepID=UPI0012FF1DC5|nr:MULTISPECIES: hypothetical protein [unclassified Chryseobacterium]
MMHVKIYDDIIGFIQYQVNAKGIEFDGYFTAKWEFEAEYPLTFDANYFDNQARC